MKYVVLGGTGTLGKAIIRQLSFQDYSEIVCYSRCELKQKQMQKEFKSFPRLSFRLGDIRSYDNLLPAIHGADVIFHVAALKHVDVLEENPEESIQTNILGTLNVADAAINSGVKRVIFSSTDKAVDPINVYGMCKGISEKVLLRRNEIQSDTRFSIYRWGNVLGSRGSVLQSFIDSLKKEKRVYITHSEMTRFWIRIEDAVRFIFDTYPTDSGQHVLIPPIKSAPLSALIRILAELIGIKDFEFVTTGLRRGEKIHETLRSMHEFFPLDSKNGLRYSDQELREILKDTLSTLEVAS
jgi:UDP-N-acetylglucosamine 4,6-dehydratase